MKKEEIIKKLDELGIKYEVGASKADLLALLPVTAQEVSVVSPHVSGFKSKEEFSAFLDKFKKERPVAWEAQKVELEAALDSFDSK